MDAKEFQYNDVVINGFVALFINLAILPLLVVMCSDSDCSWYPLHCLVHHVCRLYAIGTE